MVSGCADDNPREKPADGHRGISGKIRANPTRRALRHLMPTSKKSTPQDFEKLLSELEKIVNRMEQGDQSLEQTMKDFERGMELSEKCQKSLDQAQQRVDKLVKKHGIYQLESGDDLLDDADDETE